MLLGFLPWWRKDNLFQRVCLAWRDLPMPVIAVTHGHCIGAGLQLALACDFRFSAPDCEFSIMEIRWGLLLGANQREAMRARMAKRPAKFRPRLG